MHYHTTSAKSWTNTLDYLKGIQNITLLETTDETGAFYSGQPTAHNNYKPATVLCCAEEVAVGTTGSTVSALCHTVIRLCRIQTTQHGCFLVVTKWFICLLCRLVGEDIFLTLLRLFDLFGELSNEYNICPYMYGIIIRSTITVFWYDFKFI